MTVRVAVDAMGGDNAPDVVVEGAIQAIRAASFDLHILLFGPEGQIRTVLQSYTGADNQDLPIRIIDAPEIIGMAESPASAVKNKKQSSIHLGLTAHQRGQADAFVSAGNTGAIMAASLFILGRLPNVARPSVIGYYPTTKSFCIILDVGTNVDCKPEHLLQFAKMGTIYARAVMKREKPVVALMNIGEEPGKGNEQIKSAYTLLQQDPDLHFRGNIEGRDLLHHAADVVICDGFVGNIVLKLGESMSTAFPIMVEEEMRQNGLSQKEQSLVMNVLGNVRKRFDYQEYGGAPLLGVSGNVLIGHGGSTARAIEKVILMAAEEGVQDVAGSIATALQ